MSRLVCYIGSCCSNPLRFRLKNLIRGMDTYSFPDWNTEFPLPDQRKPFGFGSSENELVELLWQDGEVVLNTQTNNRKPIQDYETISWADCPIDEAFEKEFCANLLSETPNPVRPDSGDGQPPAKRRAAVIEQAECSVRTVNSSHCASNQVANRDVEMKYGRNVSPSYRSFTDKETGGSGSSEFLNQSNETDNRKRKTRDGEESECRSDATKLDSTQKHGTSRKSRVAEVHNMSERRRRDRINERMRALQELIPHSNKSDKASMLDEAIEYMKSLQWQLQMMWMGSGMAPMMMPRFGMGMGPPMMPAVQSLAGLSRLPLVDQAPQTNQALVNYHNQMQNYMGFLHSPINAFNYGFHSAQQNTTLTPPDNANRPHGR